MEHELSQAAGRKPISIARAVVIHADGTSDVHYSYEKPRWFEVGRWYKLVKHLGFMRQEDRKAGHGC